MTSSCDYLFKFLLIGDAGVGKSSLILRFADDVFFSDQYLSTIGVDFKLRSIELDDSKIKMQLWDFEGRSRNRFILTSYYRRVNGIFMVYDVTEKESFDNITRWAESVDKNASEDVVKILLGNKADLQKKRLIDYSEGKALADHLGVSFLETSAKDKTNVEQAFVSMATNIKANVGKTIHPSKCIPALKVYSTESNSGKIKTFCGS